MHNNKNFDFIRTLDDIKKINPKIHKHYRNKLDFSNKYGEIIDHSDYFELFIYNFLINKYPQNDVIFYELEERIKRGDDVGGGPDFKVKSTGIFYEATNIDTSDTSRKLLGKEKRLNQMSSVIPKKLITVIGIDSNRKDKSLSNCSLKKLKNGYYEGCNSIEQMDLCISDRPYLDRSCDWAFYGSYWGFEKSVKMLESKYRSKKKSATTKKR